MTHIYEKDTGNDWLYSLGQLVGMIGAKMYDKNMNRDAYKNNQILASQAGTDLLRDRLGTANNQLERYVDANNAVANNFQGLADRYNQAQTDADRNALVPQLNAAATAINPNFSASDPQGYTAALQMAQRGTGANQTNTANISEQIKDLNRQIERSQGYEESQRGNKISNNSFVRYRDYMNNLSPQIARVGTLPRYVQK